MMRDESCTRSHSAGGKGLPGKRRLRWTAQFMSTELCMRNSMSNETEWSEIEYVRIQQLCTWDPSDRTPTTSDCSLERLARTDPKSKSLRLTPMRNAAQPILLPLFIQFSDVVTRSPNLKPNPSKPSTSAIPIRPQRHPSLPRRPSH